jgi:hypothetical protein
MNTTDRKLKFAAILVLILLAAMVSACATLAPAAALAEGQNPAPTAVPAPSTSQPVGAATIRYMCDGGKLTTVIVGKIPASLGVYNTGLIPFNCAMLADYQVSAGFDISLKRQPLPGQTTDLPILADTIVTVYKK